MRSYIRKEDRIGQVFGRLTIESVYKENRRPFAKCICSCGKVLHSRIDALQSGLTVSCGCYMKEIVSETHTTHGKSSTRTYKIWDGMKARCDNVNSVAYPEYGGSGIIYQPSWGSFENFLNDMGECPPKMSLDRIDGTKGYFKENCRWATYSVQARNQSKRVNAIYSKYVGVCFDKRAKTGGWLFKAHKDYKYVSKYCSSEEQAAAYYNFCSSLLYSDIVSMNAVDYILQGHEKELLTNLVLRKFPELDKENNNE